MKTFNEWLEERQRLDENVVQVIGHILNKVFNPLEWPNIIASIPMAGAGGAYAAAERVWKGLGKAVRGQIKDAATQFGLAPLDAIATFLKTMYYSRGSIQWPGQEVV